MNKDNNISQKALFFFITIFFVIGAVFAFSNKKKIVDFFRSKGILKSIRIPPVQNVPQRKNSNNKITPSPLNSQNSRKRPNNDRRINSNSSDKGSLPKNNRVNINEEKDDDDDDDREEDEYEEEEYRKKKQNNYLPKRDDVVPNGSRRNESNSSSGDLWFFSFFKNIISIVVWLFTLVMEIIIKFFFIFFTQIITSIIGVLIFICISMVIANNLSFLNWIPNICYAFCSAQLEKINFLNSHRTIKNYAEKFLKFILRANPPQQQGGAVAGEQQTF